MNTNEKFTDTSPTPAAKRKPYEKPSFRSEKVFVTYSPFLRKDSQFVFSVQQQS